MREELKARAGKRGRFSAKVEKFGAKSSYGYAKQTMLVTDVRDESGNQVTDHLWFTVGKQIRELELKPGDRIEFVATVRPYRKGYRGRREDDYLPAPSIDYGLKFPREFRKVVVCHLAAASLQAVSGLQTPLFPDGGKEQG